MSLPLLFYIGSPRPLLPRDDICFESGKSSGDDWLLEINERPLSRSPFSPLCTITSPAVPHLEFKPSPPPLLFPPHHVSVLPPTSASATHQVLLAVLPVSLSPSTIPTSRQPLLARVSTEPSKTDQIYLHPCRQK